MTDAASNVAFYRERGLRPREFKSLDELRELPLLTKSDVQRAGSLMISDLHRGRRITEVHTGGTTGKPLAIYCDSETLQRNYAFFDRFKELNVRSNAQLDELVDRAQRAVRGVAAQDLRDGEALRRHVAAQLSQVQSALDGLLVERPRRRILRQAATPGGA